MNESQSPPDPYAIFFDWCRANGFADVDADATGVTPERFEAASNAFGAAQSHPQPPPASTLPPEKCRFCDAPIYDFTGDSTTYREMECGQTWVRGLWMPRRTPQCYEREIASLRRQLDEAKAARSERIEVAERQRDEAHAKLDTYQSERDAAQARVRELEAQNEINRKLALDVKERNDFYDELIALRAQVAQLRAALEFYANPETYFAIAFLGDPPCGDFIEDFEELTGELGHPDGSDWVKPGKCARAALASDGSQLLEAVREARDALALVYCDGCGSEAFPFRTGDHADASWGVRFTAVKTALANLNSAIGEVSHE